MADPPGFIAIGQIIAPDGGECEQAQKQPGQSAGNERCRIQAQHQRARRVIRAIKSRAAGAQVKQRMQQCRDRQHMRENLMPAQAAIHADASADDAKAAREQKFQQQRRGRHHGDGAGRLIQPRPRGADQPPAKCDRQHDQQGISGKDHKGGQGGSPFSTREAYHRLHGKSWF